MPLNLIFSHFLSRQEQQFHVKLPPDIAMKGIRGAPLGFKVVKQMPDLNSRFSPRTDRQMRQGWSMQRSSAPVPHHQLLKLPALLGSSAPRSFHPWGAGNWTLCSGQLSFKHLKKWISHFPKPPQSPFLMDGIWSSFSKPFPFLPLTTCEKPGCLFRQTTGGTPSPR